MTEITGPGIDNIRVRLAAYKTEYGVGLDKWAVRCCELAIGALERGDYGVGAVLLDRQENLLIEESNRVFSAGYNSSAHAEMRLLDQFEKGFPDYSDREGLTLIASLEPCPMCTARILVAGIGKVIYLVRDKDGGMMSQCKRLPDAWINLSYLVDIKEYSGSKEISLLAFDIANAQLSSRREKLIRIIRP